jgi:hypothetical protein
MNVLWIALSIYEQKKYDKCILNRQKVKEYMISNIIISFL